MVGRKCRINCQTRGTFSAAATAAVAAVAASTARYIHCSWCVRMRRMQVQLLVCTLQSIQAFINVLCYQTCNNISQLATTTAFPLPSCLLTSDPSCPVPFFFYVAASTIKSIDTNGNEFESSQIPKANRWLTHTHTHSFRAVKTTNDTYMVCISKFCKLNVIVRRFGIFNGKLN